MIELSIVVTLYKSAAYMRKCINSLLNQDISKDRYEIILVNDGSPDNSKDIADEYASQYANIHVLSHENIGLAGARNTGLNYASGKYLCFVDPDDYIEPNSFADLLQKMRDDDLDILRFDYQMVNEEYEPMDKPRDAAQIDYTHAVLDGGDFLVNRLGYACFVWSYIYKTSVIKDNHIQFIQGDYFDDTMWLPQVIMAAHRVDSIATKRYYYLQRQGSLVNTQTLEDTKKKIDGQWALIDKLQKKSRQVDPQSSLWYSTMYSKIIFSMLTAVASQSYKESLVYLKQLNKMDVFPLTSHFLTTKQKLKVGLLNLSPKLFCWLLSVKNRNVKNKI